MPVQRLAWKFRKIQRQWESSNECSELRELLSRTAIPRVGKIVGFGCGSIQFGLVQRDSGNSSHFFRDTAIQHAFMLTVRECLQNKQHGGEVQVIAQDPLYSDVDKQFLQAAGIMTVEDPHGWLAVDSETLVFTQAPCVPVRQIIADISTPAAMVWRKLEPFQPRRCSWLDESSPRVERMIRDHYTEVEFIKLATLSPVNGFAEMTTMYVRKADTKGGLL